MKTRKLDECPLPKSKQADDNPTIPVIKKFIESGDQYHQVICDLDDLEKATNQLRGATKALGVDGHIKVHNTYSYDDDGNRGGRILWLENMKAN